jgi:hypothetical protein
VLASVDQLPTDTESDTGAGGGGVDVSWIPGLLINLVNALGSLLGMVVLLIALVFILSRLGGRRGFQ